MQRIIVVEDETVVGLDLCLQLEDAGFDCIGPAPDVRSALRILESVRPELAVLDANLGGASSAPVAERLIEMQVPFVYVSGYGEEYVRENLPGGPLVGKPVRFEELLRVMGDLAAGAD